MRVGLGRISVLVGLQARASYAATPTQRFLVCDFSKSRPCQYFSTTAQSKSNLDQASNVGKPSTPTCGSVQSEAPVIGRGLEQKTIDDLKDMHVDAVDEEDKPFAWKNPKTGNSTLTLSVAVLHGLTPLHIFLGEIGGPKGYLRNAEPTRYGDWEMNGCGF
jgi:hypothetical protein